MTLRALPRSSIQHSFLPKHGAKGVWAAAVVLLALAIVVPPFLNPYYLRVLVIGLLYGYVAASWNIIGGYAGQMSLGHAIFFGIGSYAAAVFSKLEWYPLIAALPVGVIASGLVAWCIASICFRYSLRGIYFAIGTLLLAEIARIGATNSEFLGRSQGLQVAPQPGILNVQFASEIPFYYIFLGVAVLMMLGSRWLERSKLGHDLIALREQEEAAQALGVDTDNIKRLAFVLSGMLTAVGGFLYACLIKFVEPGYDLALSITLIMVMGAVLGGRGTAVGPFVGGLIVVFVQEALTTMGSWVGTTSVSALAQMCYGLFFVVTLLLYPRGLVGEWIRRRADKRAAQLSTAGESRLSPMRRFRDSS